MDETCIRRKKDTIKKDTIKNFKIHLLLSFEWTESSQAAALAGRALSFSPILQPASSGIH